MTDIDYKYCSRCGSLFDPDGAKRPYEGTYNAWLNYERNHYYDPKANIEMDESYQRKLKYTYEEKRQASDKKYCCY